MVNKTVAIDVFFANILKSMKHKEPESRKTTDAEIIIGYCLPPDILLGILKNPFILSAYRPNAWYAR
jgi:hypothetical protein